MRAWLVTWEWTSDSAAVADEIAAVLPSRWSERRVTDVVEQLYALHTSNLQELAAYARNPKSNPYLVRSVDGHADILSCGAHPWLFARKVSKFTVSVDPSGHEMVTWVEPDRYRMEEGGRLAIVLDRRGRPASTKRVVTGPLSRESIWDRSAGMMKPGFSPRAG
jgi:hypothetical protein